MNRMLQLTLSLAFFALTSSAFAASSTYEKLREFDLKGSQVTVSSINPHGECIAAAIDTAGKMTVLDICKSSVLWSIKINGFNSYAQTIAWSNGGRHVAVSSVGKIDIYDALNGTHFKEFRGETDSVYVTSSFSSDSKYFAAKDFSHENIVVYDLLSGGLVQNIATPASEMVNLIRSTPDDRLAFSTDNSVLFVSGMRSLKAFRVNNGAKIREYNSPHDMFSAVFGSDIRVAAFVSAKPGVDGEAKIIDLESMKEISQFSGLGNVYGGALRFSQDEKRLFWMSMKGNMKIWTLRGEETPIETDNPDFEDPFGTFLMVNSKPLLRFTFDLAPSHQFFVTAHPGTTSLEVWTLAGLISK